MSQWKILGKRDTGIRHDYPIFPSALPQNVPLEQFTLIALLEVLLFIFLD